MPAQFMHGIEMIEIDDGLRPIRTVRSSVIFLAGTAASGPTNTPTLIHGSKRQAQTTFGAPDGIHTIPDALDAIFDQTGAMVVVVRVPRAVDGEGEYDHAATTTNIIGGVDVDTGAYTGIQAALAARSETGVQPRILIAPGFTHQDAVVQALLPVVEHLKGIAVIDGPNTTDAAAITYRELFGSPRLYLIDPHNQYWSSVDDDHAYQPASARAAGLFAKSDNERGFWWSPSNQVINGVTGVARPIDWGYNDPNTRANLLNENAITTIIHEQGYRLWGNRSLSSDPRWQFINVRRTADIINDSLMYAHLWAVDRGITRTYFEEVTGSVNAYLRYLKSIGAILGGKCWADPDLNTPERMQEGEVYFDFDFTPIYPAEHVTFRSHMVNDYLSEVLV